MTTKEAQSEAPSVEKLLLSVDEDWSICTGDGKCTDKGALYDCDLDQHVMNSDQVKALEAKINRLIVLAKLEGFDIAFDCHDYDRLRAYKEQLTKELGDSEAEKNSGTWSRL